MNMTNTPMEEFKLTNNLATEETNLQWKYGSKTYNIVSRGMVMYLAGAKGSYKSTLTRGFLAAALNPDGYMGYTYKPNGKMIVLIDTESPLDIFQRSMRDLLKMSNLTEFPSNFKMFRLAMIVDPVERRAAVMDFIRQNKDNIDIIAIDLLADLVLDESSIEESNNLLQEVTALAEISKSLVIITSHTTESGGLLNHLGKKIDRKSRTGLSLYKTLGWVIVMPTKDTYEPLPVSEFKVTEERLLMPGDYIPFGVFSKPKIY